MRRVGRAGHIETHWGVCLAHWVHDWGMGRVSVVAMVAVSPGGRAEAARLRLGFIPRGGRRWGVWVALGHVQRGRSGVGPSGVMAACRRGLGCVWEGRGGLSAMGAWRGCGWGAGAHVSRAGGLVVAGRGCVGRVTVLSRVAVSVRRGLRARVGVRSTRDTQAARPGCARGHGAREGAFVYAATWAGRLCCKRLWTRRGHVRGTVVRW